MIVVADASPFIALAKIEALELLPLLFGSVTVPQTVADELLAGKKPDAARQSVEQPATWLTVSPDPGVLPDFGLDAGETAALQLALDLKAGRVVIDESKARRVAKRIGLQITGTVGVLLLAAENGHIDLLTAFGRLKATDFRFPETGLDTLLAEFQTGARNVSPTSRGDFVTPCCGLN